MSKGRSVPTRVNADVAARAAAVATQESRTFAEQVNHWARIGMQIERSGSIANRRVLAVAAGEEPFTSLSRDERTAAHAIIDAEIDERAAKQYFGRDARAAGHTTVSLDDDGNLIEISPGGERRRR